MTDFDKWQIAEARCADLQARCERLEDAAADMRERAANQADAENEPELADAIRALPTEKAAPAGEG